MTTARLAALSLAFSLAAFTAGQALAADRHVTINNKTSVAMTEFYASNTGTDKWEENILGDDTISAGDSTDINIDDGTGACKFDFKAVFKDGTSTVSANNNVCELSSFSITE